MQTREAIKARVDELLVLRLVLMGGETTAEMTVIDSELRTLSWVLKGAK